jgi:hypothetical protein
VQAVKIVRIVADRFGATSDGGAIDLATGAAVRLKIGIGGGAAKRTRWSLRCDALQNIHHPGLAALIDYGPLGESQRFEAWQCAASQRGSPEEAARVLDTLEAPGLAPSSVVPMQSSRTSLPPWTALVRTSFQSGGHRAPAARRPRFAPRASPG